MKYYLVRLTLTDGQELDYTMLHEDAGEAVRDALSEYYLYRGETPVQSLSVTAVDGSIL